MTKRLPANIGAALDGALPSDPVVRVDPNDRDADLSRATMEIAEALLVKPNGHPHKRKAHVLRSALQRLVGVLAAEEDVDGPGWSLSRDTTSTDALLTIRRSALDALAIHTGRPGAATSTEDVVAVLIGTLAALRSGLEGAARRNAPDTVVRDAVAPGGLTTEELNNLVIGQLDRARVALARPSATGPLCDIAARNSTAELAEANANGIETAKRLLDDLSPILGTEPSTGQQVPAAIVATLRRLRDRIAIFAGPGATRGPVASLPVLLDALLEAFAADAVAQDRETLARLVDIVIGGSPKETGRELNDRLLGEAREALSLLSGEGRGVERRSFGALASRLVSARDHARREAAEHAAHLGVIDSLVERERSDGTTRAAVERKLRKLAEETREAKGLRAKLASALERAARGVSVSQEDRNALGASASITLSKIVADRAAFLAWQSRPQINPEAFASEAASYPDAETEHVASTPRPR